MLTSWRDHELSRQFHCIANVNVMSTICILQAGAQREVNIRCSFLEIYNEVSAAICPPARLSNTKMFGWYCDRLLAGCSVVSRHIPLLQVLTDLLNPEATHLLIREDVKKGIFVENLSSHIVHNSKPYRSSTPFFYNITLLWHSDLAELLNDCGSTTVMTASGPISQQQLTPVSPRHPAVEEVAALLEQGQLNRKIGETMMNSESSRSHSVFTAVLECKTTDDSGITHVLSSRLNLVDLAGARLRHPVCCSVEQRLVMQGFAAP